MDRVSTTLHLLIRLHYLQSQSKDNTVLTCIFHFKSGGNRWNAFFFCTQKNFGKMKKVLDDVLTWIAAEMRRVSCCCRCHMWKARGQFCQSAEAHRGSRRHTQPKLKSEAANCTWVGHAERHSWAIQPLRRYTVLVSRHTPRAWAW